MIRTVIAEDHSIFVIGLKKTLAEFTELNLVVNAIVTNGLDLEQTILEQEPDLLLLDLNLPGAEGLDLIAPIKKLRPKMRIIVLTIYHDTKLVRDAFKKGVDGYILKSCKREELFKGIQDVIKGKTFMGEGVSATDRPNDAKPGIAAYQDTFMRRYNLTCREMEILKMISSAMTNKQISIELYISDQTVGVHRKNIMRKLGVNSTASLVRLVMQENIV
jgi:DNA-binding NarL/FixJ family response regulator